MPPRACLIFGPDVRRDAKRLRRLRDLAVDLVLEEPQELGPALLYPLFASRHLPAVGHDERIGQRIRADFCFVEIDRDLLGCGTVGCTIANADQERSPRSARDRPLSRASIEIPSMMIHLLDGSPRGTGRGQSLGHLLHHGRSGDPDPAVPLPAAIGDRAFKRRLGEREEVVEPVDSVVQEIVVGLAHPDVQLAPELGAELGPVGFEHPAQVVRLPVLGCLVVDRSGPGSHSGTGRPSGPRAP